MYVSRWVVAADGTALIVTALPLESSAVRPYLSCAESLVHPWGTRAERGRLAGTPWHIVLAEIGEGTLNSATLTERLNTWLRPDVLLFVGIAAGLKDDIGIGDVVVATKVYAVHGGKQTPEGFRARPEAWRASHSLEQAARHALRDTGYPVHLKPIAVGDVLLADAESDFARRLYLNYNDAAAYEMEGAGVTHAAHLAGRLDALIIRGISDKGGADKSRTDAEGSQPKAARNAAAAAIAILRTLLPTGTAPGHQSRAAATAVSLPPAPAVFSGRVREAEQLLTLLDPAQSGPSAAAVAGLAGSGKTALALHVAHQAAALGWFPGGVLFLSLHGYRPDNAITSDQAVLTLLRALRDAPEELPATADEQSAAYQAELSRRADQNRPVLIIADDASGTQQIRSLIPARREHRLIVTSRHTLDASTGARLIDLSVLDPADSVDLLRSILLQARDDTDTRVDDEPGPARQLAELCGNLPLALQICGAIAADAPTRPLASLARSLGDAHRRLDRLSREDRAVRAAFDVSYQQLPDAQAMLFRLFPLNPGPDLSTEGSAALAGLDLSLTEDILQDLQRAHLVEPSGGVWGRWRMHDLVRLYASEIDQDGANDRTTALERLLRHYRTQAAAANSHLTASADATPSSLFQDRQQALTWLEEERLNLVATVIMASEIGAESTATSLAFSLAAYLQQYRFLADWITVTVIALDIFHRAGDERSTAQAFTHLGMAHRDLRQFDQAVMYLQQAVDTFASTRDRSARAMALDALGAAWREMHQYEASIGAHAEAASVFDAIQDLAGHARALTNLGAVWREISRPDRAIPALRQAVRLTEAIGDQVGKARVLINLGAALRESGQFEEAISCYGTAITSLREARDQHGEATARHNRGDALQHVERFAEAIDDHAAAADYFRQARDPHHLAMALSSLAAAHSEQGQHALALEIAGQAVEIRRQLAAADPHVNRPELARTLCLSAWVRRNGRQDLPAALEMAEEGTHLYEDLAAEASDVFTANYHMALQLQSDILTMLGQHSQAEAVRNMLPAQPPKAPPQDESA
ncbi:tetratricopeptide repeat protein [Streptomyces sp. NPDC001435]|uniref:phosphorylase family protein n=1 Tax=Streptomyces sp. NPDC001435 TaxID=3364576 RepID=UPI0036BB9A46